MVFHFKGYVKFISTNHLRTWFCEYFRHVESEELTLESVGRAFFAIGSGGGDVHEHVGVIVNGNVQISGLHVRHDVTDGIFGGDVSVESVQLMRQHRILIRAYLLGP